MFFMYCHGKILLFFNKNNHVIASLQDTKLNTRSKAEEREREKKILTKSQKIDF